MNDKVIILTDLGSMKAIRLTRHEQTGRDHLETIDHLEPEAPHQRLSDVVSDQAGRFPVADGSRGGAMSNGENLHLEQESQRRTIKLLASQIQQVLEREHAPAWYFAANDQIDHKILNELPKQWRDKVQKHVRKDLTKVDRSDLLGYFRS